MLASLAVAQIPVPRSGGKIAVSSGTIIPYSATSMAVVPASMGVPIGQTTQFAASVTDDFGDTIDACIAYGWTSSNLSIATINATTGLATAVGAGTAVISCADYGQSAPANLIVEVAPNFTNPATPCAEPCALSSGTQNQAYANTLVASGGTAPYTYSKTAGSWPTGVTMNSSGVFSGTPTVQATSTFTTQLCDAISACITLQMSILVAASHGAYSLPDYIGQGVRTDFTTVGWPAVPPKMGPNTCVAGSLLSCGNQTGAGTCVTDSDFGYQVCRLTDITMTRPGVPYANLRIASSGSGDEQIFNSNSPPDRLIIGDLGGADYPMVFSDTGSAMSAGRMYAAALPATNGFTFAGYDGATWARNTNTPYLAYVVSKTTPAIYHFDFSSLVTPPSSVLDFDFTSCLNTAAGGTFGPVTWRANGASNSDDSALGYGFSNSGGQAGLGAVYVAVWKRGSGCRVLNLSTMSVTGDWGPTGPTVGITCAGIKIHNVKMAKGSNAIHIATNPNCGYTNGFVWFWDTLTFQRECTANCSGHWSYGMTHWFNNAQNNVPDVFDIRTIGDAAGSTGITPALPPSVDLTDSHWGWNSLDDNFPILGTSTHVRTPCVAPTSAWSFEVLGMWPYPAAAMRFAKTLAQGCNDDFNIQNAIGGASADGRYYAWSSDWLGTLGGRVGNGTAGGSTCVAGALDSSWAVNTSYTSGTRKTFTTNNPGGYVYQVTSATGLSAAVRPSWNQTVGGTTTDNQLIWTNMGMNCRGDVFVVRLTK